MDSRSFLGVHRHGDSLRWSLPVTPDVSTSEGFLFGGCGLGAAISALEGTTGRQLVWATAQYLSYARPPDRVDIDVTVVVDGHQTSQARAVCHVGDREILTVNAALGERPLELEGQWATMPDVPSPLDCPVRDQPWITGPSIGDHLEQRLAKGRPFSELPGPPGDGATRIWARLPRVIEGIDAATLAVLGDFVPMGVGQALGVRGGGNSLDNTLRVGGLVSTEWVLLDIEVHVVSRGFGHGQVRMFAEDGTLLAIASQSCIVRYRRDSATEESS